MKNTNESNNLGLPDSMIRTMPKKGPTIPSMRKILTTGGPLKSSWGIQIPNMRKDGPMDVDDELVPPKDIPPPPQSFATMTARPKRKKEDR